jgi:LacI family transcriptional regulator
LTAPATVDQTFPVVNRFPTLDRTTITDVALTAGVAKATVSKFLSPTEYYMSVKTRERIEKAIRELDYRPNALAQSLSTRRSMTVGVLVASIANPFYPELVAGVEDVIVEAGYTLLLGSCSESPEREAGVVRSMIDRHVDGVIVASSRMRDRGVQDLLGAGTKVVVASRELVTHISDTVAVDNRLGGRLAALHLRDEHHFTSAAFLGVEEVLAFRHRLVGFRSVFGDKAPTFFASSTGLEDATGAAAAMLARHRPRAVFAASDTLAFGVMSAAERLGLLIPGDLALVGFDDIWVSGIPGVSLTTVSSRARQVGQMAATMLGEQMANNNADAQTQTSPPRRVLVTPELVVRRSCGC